MEGYVVLIDFSLLLIQYEKTPILVIHLHLFFMECSGRSCKQAFKHAAVRLGHISGSKGHCLGDHEICLTKQCKGAPGHLHNLYPCP